MPYAVPVGWKREVGGLSVFFSVIGAYSGSEFYLFLLFIDLVVYLKESIHDSQAIGLADANAYIESRSARCESSLWNAKAALFLPSDLVIE